MHPAGAKSKRKGRGTHDIVPGLPGPPLTHVCNMLYKTLPIVLLVRMLATVNDTRYQGHSMSKQLRATFMPR
ncbi:hypothetical protein M404DRAFT_997336 [Pisolithus tinctorius Marx 270]|uniref:Uncharacterized protein n=1 Tax=Pisolithus tinctorius Marx 270 TaxID=870435 RepID=A0A0C3P5K2_PISTI|nr:hypothetical protein M404DRAFT_997336 [Pisolithus tinctorius Marx 270]